ncbi:MAG: helix-turn-helix domain-containing protein [Lewinellaceae bacterium]|nr:helix-turn-helix domain-containing protein [Lewinellaceae bacterium]
MRIKAGKEQFTLLLSLIGLFPGGLLSGQERIFPEPSFPPRVEVFELPGGKLGNRARDIVQDSVGFLWFTSSYGLHRYDGYEARAYMHVPGDSTTIPSHLSFCLHVARDGSLWVGTYNQRTGLCRYDYATETFSHVHLEPPEEESRTSAMVNVITDDAAGNLWVGTQNRGLYRVNRATGRVRRFFHDPDDPGSLSYDQVASLLVDSRGTLWVGTGAGRFTGAEGGLNRYEPATESFTHYFHEPGNPHSLLNNKINALLEDSYGNFWVGSRGDGLHRMDRDKGSFQRYQMDFSQASSLTYPYVLSANAVSFICEGPGRRLWAGAYLGGVNCYCPESGTLEHFEYNKPGHYGLKSEFAFAMCASADGVIWLGPGEDFNPRVQRIDMGNRHFSYYRLGNQVQALAEDRNGITWIGTRDSGLISINRETGALKRYHLGPPGPEYIMFQDIKSIYEGREGQLWIGFIFNRAFVCLDPQSGTRKEYAFFPDNPGPAYVLLTDFQEDRSGRLWISSIREGIFLFDKKTESIRRFQPPPSPQGDISLLNVTKLFLDSRGRMWIGCAGGRLAQNQELAVSCVDFEKDSIFQFKLEPQFSELRNYINGIGEDEQGNIWISAFQTLFKLEPVSGRIRQFHYRNNPAFQSGAFSMAQDEKGRLWLSGLEGFTCFDPLRETALAFRPEQVAHDLVRFHLAGYRNKKGELFFGDAGGFHVFNPEMALQEAMRFQPKVTLTEFRLADAPLKVSAGSPLKRSIWETEALTLKHYQNVFSIHFSSFDFRMPRSTRFQYILEGYDPDWKWAGTDPMAGYSKVPPGTYRFRVKALTNGGIWSKQAELEITITPPWWANIWAYSIYIIGAITLIYFFTSLWFRRRLAQSEARALRQLDLAKTRLYTNISHEFRTPITVILGMAQQAREQPEKWLLQGLDMITENASRLLRLANQMLGLSKLEAGAMEAHLEQGDVIAFLRYLVEPFEWYARSRDVELEFHATEAELWMGFDPEKLTQICSNLLSNAIKFTPGKGRVGLEAFPSENAGHSFLTLVVWDTGTGIAPEHLPHIFERFYSTPPPPGMDSPGGASGIGLALTRELVKLLGGQIRVESAAGKGTTFTVQLPVHQAATLFTGLRKDAFKELWREYAVTDAREAYTAVRESAKEELPLVLAVEDNPDVVVYLRSFLEEKYQVETARDGAQGIEKAIELIPDIIVSDVMMPVKSGLELCETLKQDNRTCHIPIILLTARAGQPSRNAGLQRGADAYLAKPFDRQELLVRMAQLIEGRQHLQQYYLAAAGFSAVQAPADKDAISSSDHAFVQQVRNVVLGRLDDYELKVQDIAEAIYLSSSQLHRKLKALTGLSTNHFIRSVRLQEACRLLQDPGRSITSIAFDTGFQHPDYFAKVFHREFNMTPTEYRENGN